MKICKQLGRRSPDLPPPSMTKRVAYFLSSITTAVNFEGFVDWLYFLARDGREGLTPSENGFSPEHMENISWETFQWFEVQPWQIVLEPVKFQLLQLIRPQQNIVEAQNTNIYMKPNCQKSRAMNLVWSCIC